MERLKIGEWTIKSQEEMRAVMESIPANPPDKHITVVEDLPHLGAMRVHLYVELPESRMLEFHDDIETHDEALKIVRNRPSDGCVSFTISRKENGKFSIQFYRCLEK